MHQQERSNLPRKMTKEEAKAVDTTDMLDAISENDDNDHIFSSSASSSSHSGDASVPDYSSFHSSDGSNDGEYDEDFHNEDVTQEQEVFDYFLRCLNLVRNSEAQDGDEQVDDGIPEVDENGDGQTRQHCPKSNSSSLTSISLLENSEVLKALQRSLRCPSGLAEGLDPTIALYIKLFEFAQTQRHKKYVVYPYGILGLFRNLSDIRADLLWAQDAIHRRETAKPYVAWNDYYCMEQNGLVYPYFSVMMIVISLFMMILAFNRNGWAIESMDVNGLIGPSPEVLLSLGALKGQLMVENQEWWRLITPMVLHAGIIHLVINLACIALLGRYIERSHGFLSTGVLFVLSSVGGNMISALMQPGYVLVGASGGIFGLMGLCVADIILNWRLLFLIFDQRPAVLAGRLQNMGDEERENGEESINKREWCPYNYCTRLACGILLCLDIFVNSVAGFTPLVDNYAHLGGMFYGFLFSLPSLKELPLGFVDQAQQNAPVFRFCQQFRQFALRFLGTICATFLLMISVVLITQSNGLYSPCLPCRYMSCVPFPFWVSEEKRWWTCDVCDGVHGQVFQLDESPYVNELEIYCPQGYTKDIDIFDSKYPTFDAVYQDLDAICQRECE